MAGYSRLMGEDEESMLAALTVHLAQPPLASLESGTLKARP